MIVFAIVIALVTHRYVPSPFTLKYKWYEERVFYVINQVFCIDNKDVT